MSEGFIIPVKSLGYKVPSTDRPIYTYTGDSSFIGESDGNWKIKFLSSGTLRFTTLNSAKYVDIFCVGAGGNGTFAGAYVGGGGGYTTTSRSVQLTVNTDYNIIVGVGQTEEDGEDSKFGNIVIAKGGGKATHGGGNGGSGGAGAPGSPGTDGGNGSGNSSFPGGIGQGTTTREFGESTGDLYATGGSNISGVAGAVNTGNGSGADIAGGSGIVIIRNAR